MLEQGPDIVKAFLRGMIRGFRFAKDEKNQDEVNGMVRRYQWERKLGWKGFDCALENSFGIFAKSYAKDCEVKGLDSVIEEEKIEGLLPETFSLEQVVRLGFLEEAAREVDRRFGVGGYE
jgi:hypothetical protein